MRKLIKRWFGLYDLDDIDRAFNVCGNATDRGDLEWKVKNALRAQK